MFLHTYFYQKWDKKTEMNEEYLNDIIWTFSKILFLNDFVNVCLKFQSIKTTRSKTEILFSVLAIPILVFSYSLKLFWSYEIESYPKTFFFSYFIWIFLNFIKTIIIYFQSK